MSTSSRHGESRNSAGTGGPAVANGRTAFGRLQAARSGGFSRGERGDGQPLYADLSAGGKRGRHRGEADAGPMTQASRPVGRDGAGLGSQAAHEVRLLTDLWTSQRRATLIKQHGGSNSHQATRRHSLQQRLPGGVAACLRAHPTEARTTGPGARRGRHCPAGRGRTGRA